MKLPTQKHSSIIIDDLPKNWGFLYSGSTTTDEYINKTIGYIISYYIADFDMAKVFKSMRILEDKYPDCEIYAKETMGKVMDVMEKYDIHSRRELSISFKKNFWNES